IRPALGKGRPAIIAKTRARAHHGVGHQSSLAGALYAKLRAFRACLTGLMLPLSPSLLPNLIAACLYAAAIFYQGTRLARGTKADKRLLGMLGAFAVVAQGTALCWQLLTPL